VQGVPGSSVTTSSQCFETRYGRPSCIRKTYGIVRLGNGTFNATSCLVVLSRSQTNAWRELPRPRPSRVEEE
jgi:hypothetical protein